MKKLKKMSKKERKQALLEVANEIQKLCGFDVEPEDKMSVSELEEWLTDAHEDVNPDDDLSDDVFFVFTELGLEIKKEKKPSKKEKEKKEKGDGKESSNKRDSVILGTPRPKSKAGKGIIATIVDLIETADKKKGVTKDQILNQLVKTFPDREEVSMKNTINAQVPNRIIRERFKVGKTDKGGYFKKGNK